MGVHGFSYGADLGAYAIGKSTLFRAAVLHGGCCDYRLAIADWVSKHGGAQFVRKKWGVHRGRFHMSTKNYLPSATLRMWKHPF